MQDEKALQIAASMIRGVGDKTIKTLISNLGSCKALFNTTESKLSKINGVGTFYAGQVRKFNNFELADQEIEKCNEHNISTMFFTEEHYPERLKQIADSPTLLYYKGNAEFNNHKAIAIVGTRNCTSYGIDFIEQLVHDLQPHNPLIVSGLAYGIDIAAHKAALKYNLQTVGIMGTGMDIIYPSVHKNIANKMCENGGLITEYRFKTKPEAYNFPERNRIIAGMADAVIIVEAKERGGALITAEIANSYNKDVFALPGDISKATSVGCNHLIRNHKANIITSAKDIEYILGWDELGGKGKKSLPSIDISQFDETEQKIVKIILDHNNELLIDDISWKSQVPLNKLASHLLNLELMGVVKPMPGKKYKVI